MKNMLKLVTLVVSLSCGSGFAADWPWAYGPRRNHTSDQKKLLRTWPQEGPKLLWTVPMGAGFGGPAVARGNVYLLDRDEKVGDTLRVLDLASGKELWTFAYDAPGSFMFAGSRTTPTVDGELVYTVGPMGDLHAISTKTRTPAWRKNIWKDFGGAAELPRWASVGYAPRSHRYPGTVPRRDPPQGGLRSRRCFLRRKSGPQPPAHQLFLSHPKGS